MRKIGKSIIQLWAALVTLGAVVGDIRGDFDGVWFGIWFLPALSLLVVAWLALFGIGVSRGEPNP